jgi:hypothetical protein
MKPAKKKAKRTPAKPAGKAKKVKRLAGGNPRIRMADGAKPVKAYIAAMPDWKRGVGERVDAIITGALPRVKKAVKWNSPLYGVEGMGWFLGMHTFTNYVKLTFFRGAGLKPVPLGRSTTKHARHLDIREGDAIDAAQLAKWVKQAAALPGFLAPQK